MPSGGHGGGGGGSHFGSNSSHSGKKTVIRNGKSVYIYHFGHRRYYVGSSVASTILTLFLVLLVTSIFTIVLFLIPSNYSDKIQKIIDDHNRYIQMIENAEENNTYKILGKVTNYCEYDEDVNKYYITYQFSVPSGDGPLIINGYSYTIYSYHQARDLYYNYFDGNFEIAVDRPISEIDENNYLDVDSVNMDYKNYSLSDDYEYSDYVKKGPIIIAFRIIISIVDATIITIIIVLLRKNFKKDDKQETETIEINKEDINKHKKCKYCGSSLKEEENKCPNCGGTQK